jgi:ferredoxin-like protein FixX
LKHAIFQAFPEAQRFRQLWMFGNGGPGFWQAFSRYRQQQMDKGETQLSDHPMDHFARETVRTFLDEKALNGDFQFLYPGSFVLNLQSLGRLLGWHHDTPLKIGLHPLYGLWFAYRAVVLVNADEATSPWPAPTTAATTAPTTCQACTSKACIRSCPASAISEEQFSLAHCVDYRRQVDSPCAQKCIAREACPVATEYRYSDAQIRFHYAQSLSMLSPIKRV